MEEFLSEAIGPVGGSVGSVKLPMYRDSSADFYHSIRRFKIEKVGNIHYLTIFIALRFKKWF